MFWEQDQDEKALTEYLDKAREIAVRYKDDAERGHVDNIRSDLLLHEGHLLEAEQVATALLRTGEQLNNLELKFWAAYRLSKIACQKRQFDKALEWLDKSDIWAAELAYSRGQFWNLYRRGVTLIQQGNIATAEPFLKQSLSMGTSWNMHSLVAYDKHSLAQVYMGMGQLQLARQMAEEAHDLYGRLGMAMHKAEVEELLEKLPRKE